MDSSFNFNHSNALFFSPFFTSPDSVVLPSKEGVCTSTGGAIFLATFIHRKREIRPVASVYASKPECSFSLKLSSRSRQTKFPRSSFLIRQPLTTTTATTKAARIQSSLPPHHCMQKGSICVGYKNIDSCQWCSSMDGARDSSYDSTFVKRTSRGAPRLNFTSFDSASDERVLSSLHWGYLRMNYNTNIPLKSKAPSRQQ